MASPYSAVSEAELVELFRSDEPLKAIAGRLKVGPNRIRRIWTKHFGKEAVAARGRASESEALEAFPTDESFKAVARRLGMSPNTLRALWVDRLGQEAFKARSVRLQQLGAVGFGQRSKGLTKRILTVHTVCELCGAGVTVNSLQKAKLKLVLCETCSDQKRAVDRHCPVCGLGCVGAKGLAGHIARPQSGDPEAHATYLVVQEQAQWSDKVDGWDYVVCRECGLKAESLSNHFQTHGLTGQEYQQRWPDAPTWSGRITANHRENLRESAQSRAYGWTKEDLEPYADEDGRIVVAKAAAGLKAALITVLHHCRQLGLPTRNRLAWQRMVLDKASEVIGEDYQWEWSDPRLTNAETGRPFNYDGYFSGRKLIVEAHGDQHFRFSESWHGTPEEFQRQRDLDELKRGWLSTWVTGC